MSLEQRLAISSQIWSILDGLAEEYCFGKSLDNLSFLAKLASLLGDDTVLQSVNLCDNGFVKLLIDESEVSKMIETKSVQEELVKQEPVSVDSLPLEEHITGNDDNNEADLLTQRIVDAEFDNIPDSISSLSPKQTMHQIPSMSSITTSVSLKILPTRQSTTQSVDIFLDSQDDFVDTEVKKEISSIGSQNSQNWKIPDYARNDKTELLEGMSFYEVGCATASQQCYFILPRTNYCTCEHFQKSVLQSRNELTCSHVLAVWLCERVGSMKRNEKSKNLPEFPKKAEVRSTRADTLALLARRVVQRTQEFY